MNDSWDFYSAGRLVFGTGSRYQLESHLSAIQKESRILLITDPNLVQAGVVDQLLTGLGSGVKKCMRIFDGGEAEPSIEVAMQAGAEAKSWNPTVIMGLGGGSNMDLAKITAVLHTHGGQPSDYFGFNRVPGPTCPLIAIPTTAGTGSEVSHAAVLSDSETGVKVSTLSPYLRPSLALVDPELTYPCPRKVTAESGMDALTHAIEAYTARKPSDRTSPEPNGSPYPGKNPLADAMAEKAIRLIAHNLKTATNQPLNQEARENMALAATTAGLAFSNGAVALVHALEYPMGMALHCSHGQGNALLLPHVMRYNLSTRMEAMAEIAVMLGVSSPAMSQEESALEAIKSVETLNQTLGIPHRIRDLGGRRDQLEGWAQKAFDIKRLMDINPRQPTLKDLLQILDAAY